MAFYANTRLAFSFQIPNSVVQTREYAGVTTSVLIMKAKMSEGNRILLTIITHRI